MSLESKAQELARREEAINARERGICSREKALSFVERELDIRDSLMASREASVRAAEMRTKKTPDEVRCLKSLLKVRYRQDLGCVKD